MTRVVDVFTCPQCDGHQIEEIMADVTVATEVASFYDDGGLDYGEQTNSDGIVDRYQCETCGWAIPATDVEELIQFLRGDASNKATT